MLNSVGAKCSGQYLVKSILLVSDIAKNSYIIL